MSGVAYKLVDRAEWDAARAGGAYAGSAVDRADGYIHLSTPDQIAETARRHYPGHTDLVLATVDLDAAQGLVWAPSRGGVLFPHLYAALSFAAVTTERSLDIDADGRPRFEDGATEWP